MTSITLTGTFPPALPVQGNGSPYPFAMAHRNQVVFATDRAELVSVLIPGYLKVDGDDALFARYRSCVEIANTLQPRLAADAHEAGVFDTQSSPEAVLTALFTNRYEKIDDFSRWDHEVTLVLVATGYAPYTANARPEGRILWLDPYTEETYLATLEEAGVIELHRHLQLV